METAKQVRTFTMPDNGGIYGGEVVGVKENIFAYGAYDRIELVEQNLGEYGIMWLKCYKDGKVVAKFNAKYVESIEFEEGNEDG